MMLFCAGSSKHRQQHAKLGYSMKCSFVVVATQTKLWSFNFSRIVELHHENACPVISCQEMQNGTDTNMMHSCSDDWRERGNSIC